MAQRLPLRDITYLSVKCFMTNLPWVSEVIEQRKAAGLWRERRRVVSLPDGYCEVDGRRLRNLASNDYLNLAHHPRLIEAARDALEAAGVGSKASALVTGRSPYHEELEHRLARFEGEESAVLFPSGYAANVGTIAALAKEKDVVFCDRLNHASLIDGCRLSGAKLRIYRHQELDKLETGLKKASGFRRRWIVTDSLFSMDGDIAPLKELCDLAERYDASLIVDEAHATGIFGENGRGIAEWQGVEDRIAVRIGTLSKALGTLGGFVTGSQELTDYLWNHARSQMFSTALPPAICAAACRAVQLMDYINDLKVRGLTEETVDSDGAKLVDEMLERRQWLLALSHLLRHEFTKAGLEVPHGIGPIVAVIFGDAAQTMQVVQDMEAAGFLVAGIRPPTVPNGSSRIRITLTAAVTEEDIESLIPCLVDSAMAKGGRR